MGAKGACSRCVWRPSRTREKQKEEVAAARSLSWRALRSPDASPAGQLAALLARAVPRAHHIQLRPRFSPQVCLSSSVHSPAGAPHPTPPPGILAGISASCSLAPFGLAVPGTWGVHCRNLPRTPRSCHPLQPHGHTSAQAFPSALTAAAQQLPLRNPVLAASAIFPNWGLIVSLPTTQQSMTTHSLQQSTVASSMKSSTHHPGRVQASLLPLPTLRSLPTSTSAPVPFNCP